MKSSLRNTLLLGVALGLPDRPRRLHLYLFQGLFLSHQQSGRLRQLPRHAGAVRRLAEVEPSRAATCNDCHTPHNIFGKYAVKANNGFWHSFYFTTGWYPDTIEITKFDHKVTENACRRCHENITAAIDGNVVHGKAEGLAVHALPHLGRPLRGGRLDSP